MLVKVEAYHDGRSWCARGIREELFTQGKTLDELMKNLREAAALHFEGRLRKKEPLTLLLISETEVPRGKAAAG